MRHCFTRKLTKRNSLEKAHNHFLTIISYLDLQAFFYKQDGLGPNGYQIGNKTCYIPKVSKLYVENGYLC